MDRGAWWATVRGVAKSHGFATNNFIFKMLKTLMLGRIEGKRKRVRPILTAFFVLFQLWSSLQARSCP